MRRVLALLAIARVASADTGIVAVGQAREKVASALAEAIPGAVPDAAGKARAQLAAGAVPVETLARFKAVRDATAEGWKEYQHVAFEAAAAKLADARTQAESLVALPGGAELYADATLRLGIVVARQGQPDDAHALIALALALDPDRPITTAELAPDVIALVDQVRASPAPSQHVRIAAEPVGATLSVDGAEVGTTPAELDLPRGQHVVVARAPLHTSRAQAFTVDESTTSFHLALDPEVSLDAAAGDDAIREIARYAEVDTIALATITDQRVLVERCAGDRCTDVVEANFADDAGIATAARDAWKQAVDAPLRHGVVALVAPEHHRHRFCELCRNPYVLGGAAAVVVVGAIAIIVATSGSKPPPMVVVPPNL